MGNLWLGHVNCGKIFLFVLTLGGPCVSESMNLFKSTFVFLYGNPNLYLGNKARSHSAKKKAQKWHKRRELSTFFERGGGNPLCNQLGPYKFANHSHVIDQVRLNQGLSNRNGGKTDFRRDGNPQTPWLPPQN